MKPRIAVTMGDPAGIGPEICLDLLRDRDIASACTPVVIGSIPVLEKCAKITAKPIAGAAVELSDLAHCDRPAIVDLGGIGADDFTAGEVGSTTGKAAYLYISEAIDRAMAGAVAAVVTAPIHKAALRAAGFDFPGHTEIFARRTKAQRSCMMLTSDVLTCSFVTVHVGYHEVPGLLSVSRIAEVIDLTRQAMKRIRDREPKLIVCGLNPHAGEQGLFGRSEEERFILPAIEQARAAGTKIEGPLPPDTVFVQQRRAETDAVVCMYHDQGHIPLKALAFDRAVNVTLGLPIVRTSADHGTALDIAWHGKASHRSLAEAALLAVKLCQAC